LRWDGKADAFIISVGNACDERSCLRPWWRWIILRCIIWKLIYEMDLVRVSWQHAMVMVMNL
jgi:hypothetical protein